MITTWAPPVGADGSWRIKAAAKAACGCNRPTGTAGDGGGKTTHAAGGAGCFRFEPPWGRIGGRNERVVVVMCEALCGRQRGASKRRRRRRAETAPRLQRRGRRVPPGVQRAATPPFKGGWGGETEAEDGTPPRPGAAWRPRVALPRCRCAVFAAAALTGPAAGAVTEGLTATSEASPMPAGAGSRSSLAALAAPPARRGCLPQRRAARRGAARRGLDRWLRMGYSENSGVSWGPGPRDGQFEKAGGELLVSAECGVRN